VQRDHPEHVGRSGVAVLHGAAEVPEPARLSPPVAELLLAEETGGIVIKQLDTVRAPVRLGGLNMCSRRYQSKDVGCLRVAAGCAPPEHGQKPRLVPPVQPPLPVHSHAPPHLPRRRRVAEHLAPTDTGSTKIMSR
jgi:hypothetical protein